MSGIIKLAHYQILFDTTEYCAYKDIKLDCLNGSRTCGIHCLFPYTLDTDLEHNIYLIQKETENWIPHVRDSPFGGTILHRGSIRTYIKAQEVIHKKKTYRQEFTEIVEKYGFKR